MNVTAILNGPVGYTLGWTLIHLLWQATAVALILGAIRTLWTGASSNTRYLTAILGLVIVLALPVLTFAHLWSPEVPLQPSFSEETTSVAGIAWATSQASNTGESQVLEPGMTGIVSTSLPWLVGFWMIGVTLLAARLVVRTAWTSKLTRDNVLEVEGSWRRVVTRLRGKLDIRRRIEIFESALVDVPTVVGWLKPVILVPTSVFTGLTYRQIETILAHELAHVRRFDALVNFAQSIVETLFFYHPAVWWISGRIRIEREHCCDDVAIAVCGDRVAYARALTFLEEARASVPTGALAATGGSLLDRIRRIAGVEERDRKAPSIAALVVLMMLGGATAWALTSPGSEPEPDMEVEVDGSEWWVVSPAVPPAPVHPPTPASVPEPPAPAAFPEAPEAPSWIVEMSGLPSSLAVLGEGIARPELPPTPRISPLDGLSRAVLAPAPPLPPSPPHFTSVAPVVAAGQSYVVRGERKSEPDRKISDELTVDDLIRLRSVGVTTEYIKALRKMGYDDLTVGEVVSLRGVGVTTEYISAMKQEFGDDLKIRDLVSLRGVGVTPEWVASMKSFAGRQLTAEEAFQLRGVGVSPEWIGTMSRALGESLTIDDAIQLRAVGVSEDYIRELGTRGIDVPPAEDLIRLRGVGVSPEYIDEMRSTGIGELTVDNLVNLRAVGVNPGYVTGLAAAGVTPLDLETLVQLRGVGVSPKYVDSLREAGYAQLDSDTLVQLRGIGVSPGYIKGLREAGIDVTRLTDLVALRGVGVTPEYVKELRDAGLENLTIEKLIRMRAAGIDADYIRDMKKK